MDTQSSNDATQSPHIPSKRNKTKSIILTVLVILVAGIIGTLGYLYQSTSSSLKKKIQELSNAHQDIEKRQAVINKHEAVATFISEQNDEILSRQLCGGTPVGMFDVHLNDKFAVFRYLCSELTSGAPIRIASLKKLQSGAYEFTYGSSDDNPNYLPGYIYDTEPDFFGSVYGATRF